jgi:carboxyl-terminal processing protease
MGVMSDIVVPSTTNVVDEYSETTLKYAMPWDTVSSAQFDRSLMVQPYLMDLRKRSAARVSKDPDFAVLQKVIDEEKRVLNEKTVSLNEQDRLKEKKEQDARLDEVKKALAARPPSKEKVYKFTLKQADLAGLPPALDPKKEPKKASTDGSEETADPVASSLSSVDTTLEESERILLDLITLSPHATTASR